MGDLVVGRTYRRTFTFQNLGAGTLTVASVEVLGFGDETLTGAVPAELPRNASFSVTLQFKPTEEGIWQASVYLDASSESDSQLYTIDVSGFVNPEGDKPTVVLTEPAAKLVRYEEYMELSSIYFGTQPMTFTWRRNGVTVPGDFWFLRVPVMTAAQTGVYQLQLTNPYGTVNSTTTAVSMYYQKPDTVLPLVAGKSFQLKAPVVGPGLRFQWRLNGNPLVDSTNVKGTSTGTLRQPLPA
jgi:hypothetical protein